MMVTEYLDVYSPLTLTEKEIAELDDAAKCPIAYDEDCPPMTEAQIQRAKDHLRNDQRRIAV